MKLETAADHIRMTTVIKRKERMCGCHNPQRYNNNNNNNNNIIIIIIIIITPTTITTIQRSWHHIP
jgi:hypothetical protein